jgi:hypothetical protein
MVVTLPADAKVGDTVITVVTNPNGTSTTLSHVILASELPAAQGGTATGAGPFTITQLIPTSALSVEGAWTTSTTITDAAGNASTATAANFTLDTTAPTAPTAILDPQSDTGTAGDGITADTTPTIKGSGATPGDTITVIMPGSGEKLTAVVDINGNWSVTPTYTLTDGTVGNAVVTATDTAGNVSAPANVPLDIRSAPVAVAITSITNDTGTSSTDGVTTDTTPTISGTSDQPNRPVTVTIAGVSFVVMTDGNGAWSVDTGAVAATSGTWDPAVGFTTDGPKAITVSVSGGNGGSGTATGSVTLDTAAPTVLVTSVFGDAVGASGNGTFSPVERGFDAVNYTLSPTVSPLPVISGTTTAEDGQTVTVTLAGKSYTATASGGNWSVSVPSADAVLLNHGNTYAITASVSDKAGNAAVPDINNGLIVNIAAPDVPTVVSQSTLSTTPTITGLAQKLNGTSPINLAAGDALTVVLKDAAGTTTLGTYTLTVGGTSSSPAGLSYNTTTGAWSLAVPASVLPAGAATYNVDVSTTVSGFPTRSDISSGELVIATPPTITSIPEGPTVNMTEAASSGGTPVNVGLAGTGAVAGQVITVNWGGQTFTQVLTATDIANGTVSVIVPTSVIQAETPATTTESINVTVSLGNGITSAASSVSVNFVTPTAPTISNLTWAATGAGSTSDLKGIPEAHYDKHNAPFSAITGNANDFTLYLSEVSNTADAGTIVRVQLPTLAAGASSPTVAGDSLSLKWGDQTIVVGVLTAADITAKYVDVTVPLSTLETQAFGVVPVVAQVTSAATGSTSNAAPLNVKWAYDLPTTELTSQANGFAINGEGGQMGSQGYQQGAVKVGDVNGDGFDDFVLTAQAGNVRYVVYGNSGLATVELSTLEVPGNTNGFTLKGNGPGAYNTEAGDVNGDGLNDIMVQYAANRSYVVYGSTRSIGLISAIQTLPASDGFQINSTYTMGASSVVGDVNGDGFDDMLINFSDASNNAYGNFLLYGSTNTGNITLPAALTGTYSNGFFIGASGQVLGGVDATQVGDFNGDGYGDFMLLGADTAGAPGTSYVFFGGPNQSGLNSNTLSAAGNGRGFSVKGLTATNAFSMSFLGTATGDVNGDGMDDIIFNDGSELAYVMFGKTSDTPVNLSAIKAGSGGFVINGRVGVSNYMDVDVVGDFNGDGLADMVVGDPNITINDRTTGGAYLVYGRTGGTPLTMTNLAASEGFRIDGGTVSVQMGMSVSAAGDVNGDGFADLIVNARNDSPDANRQAGGISRVIYGGVDKLESMTFQPTNGDAIGTNAANTLTGTSGANQIVAGDGNDTLVGAGGADVLYGGRGDDTIVINASNIAALAVNTGNTSQAIARIDGGSGTDTLEITASLDLGTIRPAAIQSIERINMSASGTSLTMGLLDVLGLSEKNNPFNTATGWTATATGGATGWSTVNVGAQVVVDGTNTNDLYLSGNWQSIGTVQNTVGGVTKTYKVLSDLTKAEAQVLVDSNVKVHMAPTILTTANELPNTLNMTEASDGTLVKLSLVDTDAASGNTITLNWGGQTITVTLTAADITAGFVNVPVTLAQLTAETAAGTSEAVSASVTLLSGSTVVAQSGAQAIDVNFVLPTAPTINSLAWAATGAGNTSALAGIPEAYYDKHATLFASITSGTLDNKLYYSEAVATSDSGTVIRVQLATTGSNPPVAGDTLSVTWGNQVLPDYTITSADLGSTVKYVDITVPFSTIDSQAFGSVVVGVKLTSAVSGNSSQAPSLMVDWSYDLATTTTAIGFNINGRAASDKSGLSTQGDGVINVGDVNGDGYDDFALRDGVANAGNSMYVVYGRPGLADVELSSLQAVGNTNGFIITGLNNQMVSSAGDINGDGLNDIMFNFGNYTAYVFLGKTSSMGAINVSSFAANNAFQVSTAELIQSANAIGDINGDGYDDMMFKVGTTGTGYNTGATYVVYGSSSTSNIVLPTQTAGNLSNGFIINSTATPTLRIGSQTSPVLGDFNGDGYGDFAVGVRDSASTTNNGVNVYFGGPALSAMTTAGLSAAGSGRGFAIMGLTNQYLFSSSNAGDINGDGLDDLIINEGTEAGPSTRTFVVFGRTSDAPISVSSLIAGSGGFLINSAISITDSDVVGDFNGDGLADMVVSAYQMTVNSVTTGGAYLVYGRTGTTALHLSTLTASEGFRINGDSGNTGQSVTAGGDINGDGFADLVITSPTSDPINPTRLDAGVSRVVFGGPTRINSMVIQASNGDLIGTTSAEALTGTSGANQIVAGDGNDTLVGGGGADVLYGGRGDDTIVIDASNITALGTNTGNASQAIARIDGGSGTDTLEITASLDLGTIRPAAIQSIECINMSASGTSLKMGLLDVLGLSEKNNPFNTATGWTATSTGGATNWDAVNNGAQVVVDGTASNDLYLSGAWQSIGTVQNTVGGVTKTYKVLSDLTKAEAQVLVDSNVKLHLAPTILTTGTELAAGLTAAEASNGTPVRVNLAGTDAADGNTIKLNWGGQTVTVTVTAANIAAGFVDLPLTNAQLLAETPSGTSENVAASVTLLSGATTVAQSGSQDIAVSFIVPTAPVISSTAWSASNTYLQSSTSGIPESKFNIDWTTATVPTTGTSDNAVYPSEATNGTVVRVQLATSTGAGLVPAVAGDKVTVDWGGLGTPVQVELTPAHITAKYVDVTVPWSNIQLQGYETTVNVTAKVVGGTSGNESLGAVVPVTLKFDLSLAAVQQGSGGLVINGELANDLSGYSVYGAGDVNGDGIDDMVIGASMYSVGGVVSGRAYVVFGNSTFQSGSPQVELQAIANGVGGFAINAEKAGDRTAYVVSAAGDVNGDGLADVMVSAGYGDPTVPSARAEAGRNYIVYGKSDGAQVNLSAVVNNTGGFVLDGAASANRSGYASMSSAGDFNGDGYTDLLVSSYVANEAYVVYGKAVNTRTNLADVKAGSGGVLISGASGTVTGWSVSDAGDVNGDGLDDVIVGAISSLTNAGQSFVVFGKAGTTAVNLTSLTATANTGAATSSLGFAINGMGAEYSGWSVSGIGDVNGDGLADVLVGAPGVDLVGAQNTGSAGKSYVVFGKSGGATVSLNAFAAGTSTSGFVINGQTAGDNLGMSVDGAGDFNGDGLADMIVGARFATNTVANDALAGKSYLIYGKAGSAAVNLSNLSLSDGFIITGDNAGDQSGTSVANAGDINGDGFTDLMVSAPNGDPGVRTNAGQTFVIFGGISGVSTTAIDFMGTAGNDTLNGTSTTSNLNEQLVGGAGNDTLYGGGGADVMYGGTGNDTFVVNADNVAKMSLSGTSQAIARIDGGSGIDTFQLAGAGILLDLSLVSGPALQNVEKIDLTGSGNNTLKLSLADMLQGFDDSNVFNSSNTTSGLAAKVTKNQLMIDGDAGDKVVLSDIANWTAAGTNVVANGHTYVAYNHNTSAEQLLIDQTITVSAS